jgi:benzoyl-CoA reductase/2-hydroxyglutaryl-CoA dehydratase subunit BcrC/BadD/HgdB
MAKKSQIVYLNSLMGGNKASELARNAECMPVHYNDIGMIFKMAYFFSTTTMYGNIKRVMDLIYKEVRERVERGEGVLPKDAPRVIVLCSWFTNPSAAKLIEDSGLAIVADSTLTTVPERAPSKHKGFWERATEEPLRRGTRYCSMAFTRHIKQLCEESNLDGILLDYVYCCRVFPISIMKTHEVITKELELPSLLLEIDMYDTRDYNTEAMRTRVETFAEMLKARKAEKVI